MNDKNLKQDHPGIYIPPPFIYLIVFVAGWIIQKWIPLDPGILTSFAAAGIGVMCFVVAAILGLGALRLFHQSHNTVITTRPAHSLQKTGIYSKTRNPMYLGMVFFYCGFFLIFGGWWNFILLPILIMVVQKLVIRKEEKYLTGNSGRNIWIIWIMYQDGYRFSSFIPFCKIFETRRFISILRKIIPSPWTKKKSNIGSGCIPYLRSLRFLRITC